MCIITSVIPIITISISSSSTSSMIIMFVLLLLLLLLKGRACGRAAGVRAHLGLQYDMI